VLYCQKYTLTDCFSGDSAHWVVLMTLILFSVSCCLRYETCGDITLVITASNLVSNATRYAYLKVSCALRNLSITATSSSVSSIHDVTFVVVGKPLTLTVSLEEGSFAMYNISWGDGQLTQVNQSLLIDQTTFQRIHSYSTVGNYTITVTVFNELREISSEVDIRVTRCSDPAVRLEYGSRAQPLAHKRGSDIPITAYLDWNTLDGCESVNTHLVLLKWVTLHEVATSVNPTGVFDIDDVTVDEKTVVHVLRKQTINLGTYHIILMTTLNGIAQNHTAFIEVVSSPLNAYIVGSESRTIPSEVDIMKKRVSNNITLDASGSGDPDSPADGVRGLNFTWTCRARNISSLNRSACVLFGCKCLNMNFVLLNEGDTPKVSLSARHFISNVEYDFQVLVAKDRRSEKYTQQVIFVKGDPPDITLKYVCICTGCPI